MPHLLAALVLLGGDAQVSVTPPEPARDPDFAQPQGTQYGEPQGADLASIVFAPEACHGDHVIAKGRLDLLEFGRYWQLVDGHARVLLLGSYGMTGTDFDRMIGTWVEVRGICRAIRPKEYVRGVDMDTITFPDLPVLPAPRAGWPIVSITVFAMSDAGGPGRKGPGPEAAILRTVLNDPSAFIGVRVRVVGLFRGRNLFGDLPAESRRSQSDWVLKEDDTSVWVTGKAPRGKGWALDPDYKGDTTRWLAVEGKVEVVNGVAYLRASKLILTRDPRSEAAESQ
jgi:hypothetical protein